LRIASASGLIVSVIAGFYAMFPVKAVTQPLAFAIKVFAFVAIANVIGVLLYSIRGKRTETPPAAQTNQSH
jgi:F0F1-type ATP synthase membrane subunit a